MSSAVQSAASNGGRSTPANVKTLLHHARRWLASALTKEDRQYAARLVSKLNSELDACDFTGIPSLQRWRGSGVTTRIYPTLDDYPNRVPRPQFLVEDVITYDLSKCYNKRFETMGRADGRLVALRSLFADPKTWLTEHAKKNLRGVALVTFLRTVNATFPTEDEDATRKNLKLFYTRFYGLCTPRQARRHDRSGGGLRNIGLAARLQNTLYVVKTELMFRRGCANAADVVLMVQTDSITLRISAVKHHSSYGLAALAPYDLKCYEEKIAEAMSVPGVAEWKIEAMPTKAILRGLAGRYAFLTADLAASEDPDWDEVCMTVKTSPKTMLDDELKHATQLTPSQARACLMEAFERGPEGFAEILEKLPLKITRINRHGKPYLWTPELRSLLSKFVKPRSVASSVLSSSSSSSLSSSSVTRKGALDTCVDRASARTKSTGEYHFVVALETSNGKRVYKAVTESQRHELCVGNPYHEVFVGYQRAFIDYDDEKSELGPEKIQAGCESLRAFWRAHHSVDASVQACVMHCGSPIASVPSYKRHITFRAVDKASGRECVFADPKDIVGAIGETLARCTDVQPYAWKKCLRMPGSPGHGGKRPYYPLSESNFNDAEVYSNHCVCVSGANTIVHGAHPKPAAASLASDLFFPSEISTARLVFDAVRKMCPAHDVKIGSSSLDMGDPEARTVWQRIAVKCTSNGKLLDMTHFCEKLFLPALQFGKKPDRSAVGLHHKNGNNSWINFVLGTNEDAGNGYLSKIQFKVKGKQRKVMRNMLECELRLFHLHKIALVVHDGSAASAAGWVASFKAAVARERGVRFDLLSVDASGRGRRESCTLYEVRNAIRRRLRARRVREKVRLFKCKRGRGTSASGSGFEKYQTEKTKYWDKNMAKIDSAEDLGIVLGFVVSYCHTSLANKVLEIETDHVTGAKPDWSENYYKYAEVLRTSLAAKTDEKGSVCAENFTNVVQKWIEAVY